MAGLMLSSVLNSMKDGQMNIHVFALAGGVVLAALAGPAGAADIYVPSHGGLKDGGAVEETVIPEAEPFQENAEWFIRGNIGFGRFGDIDGTGNWGAGSFAIDDVGLDNVFSASIGFGRYITPNIRFGLDPDYRHHEKGSFTVRGAEELENIGSLPLELTTTSVMFSAIYDFMPVMYA